MSPTSKPVFFVCPIDDYSAGKPGHKSKSPVYASRRRKKTARTTAQNEEHVKFSFVRTAMKPFKDLHRFVFKSGSGNTAGRLSFRSFAEAVTGTHPDFGIDYSKLFITSATLPNAISPHAMSCSPGLIHFSWSVDSSNSSARDDDQALLIAYWPEKHLLIFEAVAASRNASSANLDVSAFTGHSVHTWLSFLNIDGSDGAVSVYAGEVMVKDCLDCPGS